MPPCKLWRHRKTNPQKSSWESILKLSDVYTIITGPTKGEKESIHLFDCDGSNSIESRISEMLLLSCQMAHRDSKYFLNFPIGSFLFRFE